MSNLLERIQKAIEERRELKPLLCILAPMLSDYEVVANPKTLHEMKLFFAASPTRQELLELVRELISTLEEFQLGHEHAPDLQHTRSLGDSYGWCDYCSTKVNWGPGYAEDALAKAEVLFKGDE